MKICKFTHLFVLYLLLVFNLQGNCQNFDDCRLFSLNMYYYVYNRKFPVNIEKIIVKSQSLIRDSLSYNDYTDYYYYINDMGQISRIEFPLLKQVLFYFYRFDGKIDSVIEHDNRLKIIKKNSYIYDEKGNISEYLQMEKDLTKSKESSHTLYYSYKNNRVICTYIDQAKKYKNSHYNYKKGKIDKICYYNSGELERNFKYFYDVTGKLRQVKTFYISTSKKEVLNETYRFNEKGLVISHEYEGETSNSKTEYLYDEDGLLIKLISYDYINHPWQIEEYYYIKRDQF